MIHKPRVRWWDYPPKPKRGESIFRVRRISSRGQGGANFYYHADIIARNAKEALHAAEAGHVFNWRWIDTFDSSRAAYQRYEYLYEVGSEETMLPTHAERPNYPRRVKTYRLKGGFKIKVQASFRFAETPRSYRDLKLCPRDWQVDAYQVLYKGAEVAHERRPQIQFKQAQQLRESVQQQLQRIGSGTLASRAWDKGFKKTWRKKHKYGL